MAGNRNSGFASMVKHDPKRQREIASAGGRAAHVQGKAHKWTHEQAVAAGRLGGLASRVISREKKLEQLTNNQRKAA